LATVSSVALAGAAAAADLPARQVMKAPVPVPVLTWDGFYIGLNVGAARHDWSFTDRNFWFANSGVSPLQTWTSSKTGATGGVQVGYNWQSGTFVYGFEADLNWLGLKKEQVFGLPSFIAGGFPAQAAATAQVDWLATFRGRVGLTSLNPTLVYVTGGLAIAGSKNRWGGGYASFNQLGNPIGCGCDFVDDKTRFGWTAGFGVEHMVNRNWSFKAEVLYVDLGTRTKSATVPDGTYTSEFSNSLITARVGANYRW
jgi:outer membrane immunogenic protein